VSSTVRLADVRFRRRGWSNQELAQFHRMIAILWDVGFAFETDSGVADEGEPWFVFCVADSGEMFAHFARIGGEYVVCAPCLNQSLTGATLRQLVDHFIDLCPCRRVASVRSRSAPSAR
jgi:collagen type I alpha